MQLHIPMTRYQYCIGFKCLYLNTFMGHNCDILYEHENNLLQPICGWDVLFSYYHASFCDLMKPYAGSFTYLKCNQDKNPGQAIQAES